MPAIIVAHSPEAWVPRPVHADRPPGTARDLDFAVRRRTNFQGGSSMNSTTGRGSTALLALWLLAAASIAAPVSAAGAPSTGAPGSARPVPADLLAASTAG